MYLILNRMGQWAEELQYQNSNKMKPSKEQEKCI